MRYQSVYIDTWFVDSSTGNAILFSPWVTVDVPQGYYRREKSLKDKPVVEIAVYTQR